MSNLVKYFTEAFQLSNSRNYLPEWESAIKLEQVYHPLSLRGKQCRFLSGNIIQFERRKTDNNMQFYKVCNLANCEIQKAEPLTPGAEEIMNSARTGAVVGGVLAGPLGYLAGWTIGEKRGSKEKVRISIFDSEADCECVIICDLDSAQRIAYFVSHDYQSQDINQINEEWLIFQKRLIRLLGIIFIYIPLLFLLLMIIIGLIIS